jgi:MFS transporter, OCT family, solute carrier family 22 (organic cation transporter), member 4/5
MADFYGRKKVFIASMLIQTVAFTGLYFSHDIDVTTASVFLIGVASAGRTAIGFLYIMELLPTRNQVIVATILHINTASVNLIACLYFWFLSKNWLWLELMAGGFGVLSGLGTCFLPESPKFYISQHKYDEARAAINKMARWNHHKEFHGEFDRE